MEIGFLLALVALLCLVISLAYRVDALSDELSARIASQERAGNRALAALQGLSEGKVLREAARRWESQSEQAVIRDMARGRRETDPPLPAMWLRYVADEMEGVTNCDEHEHTYAGECLP